MSDTSAVDTGQSRVQEEAQAPRRRMRMSPKAREASILTAAVTFFAERGFAAQTRDLATQLDVSESLIYRYFGTKDALVQRVYEETILSRWDSTWLISLSDRSIPIRGRLITFYRQYLEATDDRSWIRIAMYSSLDGLDLTNNYIVAHIEDLLSTISRELQLALRLESQPDFELVWQLHSSFIYYLVRKHIHATAVPEDRQRTVELLVDNFLGGITSRHSEFEE